MILEAIFLPVYTYFGLQAITMSWDFFCFFHTATHQFLGRVDGLGRYIGNRWLGPNEDSSVKYPLYVFRRRIAFPMIMTLTLLMR